MANVQLQAWGDERDSFAGIIPEAEDATVDKTLLVLFDEASDLTLIVRSLKRLRDKAAKGTVAAA